MKKILFVLIMLVCINSLFSFNYDNYKEISVNELVKSIEGTLHKNLPPGLTYFDMFIGFPIELNNYPDLSNDINYQAEIQYFTKHFNTPENTFGNVIVINLKNDYQLVLVFQNVIAKYLREDVQLGEKLGIYCYFGYYNDFGKKIVCMVSSFNTIADYKRRNVKPIWERIK